MLLGWICRSNFHVTHGALAGGEGLGSGVAAPSCPPMLPRLPREGFGDQLLFQEYRPLCVTTIWLTDGVG